MVKVGSIGVDGRVGRMLIGIIYLTTEGLELRKQMVADRLAAFQSYPIALTR